MHVISRINDWTARIEGLVLCVMFLSLTFVAFYQIFFRYVLEISTPWAGELTLYIFIWASYLGCAVAAHRDRHIEIDLIEIIYKNRSRATPIVVAVARHIIVVGFLVYFGFLTCHRLEYTATKVSPAMRINMLIPESAILAGTVLMVFHYVIRILLDMESLLGTKETVNKG